METAIRSNSAITVTIRNYLQLTKLPIVLLLVFTCVTAMVVAAGGLPLPEILVPTLIGGIMAAGGASAVNQYLDRDMDRKMQRTARRPIPDGRVKPMNALIFGLALIAWSVLILGVWVNWLASILALSGAFYYLVLYTMLLKRNTVLNIVIGGGAGAFPILVGWAAVTGTLNIEAFILFAIIFYWTPPHTWALAIMVNKDYAAVNVPMMPVARGEETTRFQILLYSIQLVLITMIPVLPLVLGATVMLGWFYLVSGLLLGLGLIWMSIKLIRIADKATARRVYKYSSVYLALLFLAMILDRVFLT